MDPDSSAMSIRPQKFSSARNLSIVYAGPAPPGDFRAERSPFSYKSGVWLSRLHFYLFKPPAVKSLLRYLEDMADLDEVLTLVDQLLVGHVLEDGLLT